MREVELEIPGFGRSRFVDKMNGTEIGEFREMHRGVRPEQTDSPCRALLGHFDLRSSHCGLEFTPMKTQIRIEASAV